MDYGWVSVEQRAHQRIGFFVDDDNRILYWPAKRGPGYVLDFERADQILSILHKSKLVERAASVAILLMLISVSFLSDSIYPFVQGYFAPGGSFYVALTLIILVPLLGVAWSLDSLWGDLMVPGVRSVLNNCETLKISRPKPHYLKRSEYLKVHPRRAYQIDLLVMFFGLAVILYGVLNGAHRIGDMLAFGVFGASIIWFGGTMLVRQHGGLKVQDIRLYRLPDGKQWSWID